MAIKKADMGYIDKETREFLGIPFIFNPKEFGGVATFKENTEVELIYSPKWNDWIDAMYYTAFTTWNNGHEINLDNIGLGAMVFDKYKKYSIEEIAEHRRKLTIDFLKKRPISAVLESAVFVIKIDNIPRSMTHQIVRHRGMSFNQESYRVSNAVHADFRIPDGLTETQKEIISGVIDELRVLYVSLINNGIPTEQARNVLPMGTCTHIVMTTNLKVLQDYIKARTMDITQDEHTYIVMLICRELMEKAPEFWESFIKTDKLIEMMKQYEVI